MMTQTQHEEAVALVSRLQALLNSPQEIIAPPPPPPPPPPEPVFSVAFSNLGPSDSYNTSSARRITDLGSRFGVNSAEYAAKFAIEQAGKLDRIELLISRLAISGNSARMFSLFEIKDSNMILVENWQITPSQASALTILKSQSNPILNQGNYCLAAHQCESGSAIDTQRGVLYRKRPTDAWQTLSGAVPAFTVWITQ